MHNNNNNKIVKIPINKLDLNDIYDARSNDQKEKEKDEIKIEQLAKSIQKLDLLTPVTITSKPKPNGHYSVVAGRRRIQACKKLGHKTIKCIHTDKTNKNDLEDVAFDENLERDNYTLDEKVNIIVHRFKRIGYKPEQVMYLAKKHHNYGPKDIPSDFIDVLERLPILGKTRPSSNYLYQVMQTITQIDPKVQKHIQKIGLRMDKRIMLTHTKLREHPNLQIALATRIKGLSPSKARLEVAQKIRDLETGAVVKSGESYTFYESKREKIDTRIQIEKSSVQNYLEIIDRIQNMMFLITGHKRTKGETLYTKEHVDLSEFHRLDILKGISEREVLYLESYLEILQDAINNFLYLIEKEVLKH